MQTNFKTIKSYLLLVAMLPVAVNLVAQTPTVASIVATGTGTKWYTTSTGGTAMRTPTPLVNAQHYWAYQTINGVESLSKMEVTVTIN